MLVNWREVTQPQCRHEKPKLPLKSVREPTGDVVSQRALYKERVKCELHRSSPLPMTAAQSQRIEADWAERMTDECLCKGSFLLGEFVSECVNAETRARNEALRSGGRSRGVPLHAERPDLAYSTR